VDMADNIYTVKKSDDSNNSIKKDEPGMPTFCEIRGFKREFITKIILNAQGYINVNVKFPPVKIFINLVSKSTTSQRSVKWELHYNAIQNNYTTVYQTADPGELPRMSFSWMWKSVDCFIYSTRYMLANVYIK
jgi:hypothetical protein